MPSTTKPKFRTVRLTVTMWSDRSTEWVEHQHLFVVMVHRNYKQQTQILLYSFEIESGGFQLFSWTFLTNFLLVNYPIDDLLIRKWAAVNRFPKIQTKQKWISIELRNYKQSTSGIRWHCIEWNQKIKIILHGFYVCTVNATERALCSVMCYTKNNQHSTH